MQPAPITDGPLPDCDLYVDNDSAVALGMLLWQVTERLVDEEGERLGIRVMPHDSTTLAYRTMRALSEFVGVPVSLFMPGMLVDGAS